jgi:hypothetical protein
MKVTIDDKAKTIFIEDNTLVDDFLTWWTMFRVHTWDWKEYRIVNYSSPIFIPYFSTPGPNTSTEIWCNTTTNHV